MQQEILFAFVLVMPFVLLSGLTTPVDNMPTVLQYLTVINPLRYAIDITHRVYLEDANSANSCPSCGHSRSLAPSRLPWRPGCSATASHEPRSLKIASLILDRFWPAWIGELAPVALRLV